MVNLYYGLSVCCIPKPTKSEWKMKLKEESEQLPWRQKLNTAEWESVRKKPIWYRRICIMYGNRLMLSPTDYAVNVYSVGFSRSSFCAFATRTSLFLLLLLLSPLISLHYSLYLRQFKFILLWIFFSRWNLYYQNYIAVRLGRSNQRLRRGQKLDRETWICIIECMVK